MRIAEGYELKIIAGENIVVCTRADVNLTKTITIKGSGEFIWERLKEGFTRAEIIKAMCNEYNAPYEVIAKDTNAFLDQAINLGIVTDD